MHKGSTGILYLKAVKDGVLKCKVTKYFLEKRIFEAKK